MQNSEGNIISYANSSCLTLWFVVFSLIKGKVCKQYFGLEAMNYQLKLMSFLGNWNILQ